MKTLRERLKRLAAPATRLVALLAATLAAGGAVATVKPIAVWNGDFVSNGQRGGFTLQNGSHEIASDKSKITIVQNKGGVKFTCADLSFGSLGVVAALSNVAKNSSRVVGLGGFGSYGAADYGYSRVWFGLQSNSLKLGSWKLATNGNRTVNDTYASSDSDALNRHYVGMAYLYDEAEKTSLYIDGGSAVIGNAYTYADDASNKRLKGFAVGGPYHDTSQYVANGASVEYVAILNSTNASDIAAWSLTGMTSAENIVLDGNDSGTLIGGPNAGVNLAGGTVTVLGEKTAAAVFVQANTTLKFTAGSSLTIGGGTGPLYIADGVSLTIDASDIARPEVATTIVSCKVFGKDQINVVTSSSSVGDKVNDDSIVIGLKGSYWKWAYADFSRILTWNTPSSVTDNHIHSADTSYYVFDIVSGSNSGTLYTNGTRDSGTGADWQYLCYTDTTVNFDQSKYQTPGTVVRFTAGDYAKSNLVADFSPLTLGGLIVEVGASGYSFKNESRTTLLGDPSGTTETWFEIKEDFAINRTEAIWLMGTINIISDAIFSLGGASQLVQKLNRDRTVNTTGGSLKMHGSGKISVPTLTTTANSTLDFSDLDLNRATPFIDGNLVVSSSTKFAFPSGLDAGDEYTLCSGALTAPAVSMVNIAVGGNSFLAGLTFDASEKSVSYTPVSSVSLDGVTGTEWTELDWDSPWSSGNSAKITLSSASSISVGNATSVAVLKLVGSANLTITGISSLSVGAFDLTEYTGLLTIDGALPASVELHGGSIAFDIADGGANEADGESDAYQTFAIAGSGDVYKRGSGSLAFGCASDGTTVANTYVGTTYVEVGMARRYSATAFGAADNTVCVRSGAVVDLVSGVSNSAVYNYTIAGAGFGGYPAMTAMNGVGSSSGDTGSSQHGVKSITLDANATIGGDANMRLGYFNYDYTTSVNLGTYTLTKVGSGTVTADYFVFSGTGTMEIADGVLSPNISFKAPSAKLKVNTGASCSATFWTAQADDFNWYDVYNDGTITASGASIYMLVSNIYSGSGTVNRLSLGDGATIKPTSNTTGMTISSALTLEGAINVDISGVDLTGRSKLPILTGPTSINKDTDVDVLTLGSNTNWELYSETVTADTTYALGVYLTTIEDLVSWNGGDGTWSVNGFNGGSENYSNQALQTVTFADDAGSSVTPLAVTVDGDKTVNALNFTANNRNVTLSGDAITAGSISKSGAGVATINSNLAVSGNVGVSSGVLVINPTNEEVNDTGAMDSGTLVVYVAADSEQTISGTISATKLIKRGAGTLNLGSANSISGGITVSEGRILATAMPNNSVYIDTDATFTLKDVGASDRFSGPGTLELLSTINTNYRHSELSFAGKLKITRNGTGFQVFGEDAAGGSGANIELTGSPSLELAGTGPYLCLGRKVSGNYIKIGNLTATSGKIDPQWNTANDSDAYKGVWIKQTANTTFGGIFNGENGRRNIDVKVYGDSSVGTKSLTLAGANVSRGQLTVDAYGKVIFFDSGSWLNGTTTVKSGGVLESRRTAQVVGALNLEANSKLTFADGCYLQAGAITLPESETVTLDFTGFTMPTGESSTTVIKTTSTNLNRDKFVISGCDNSENYYIAQDTTTGDVTVKLYAARASDGRYFERIGDAVSYILVNNHSVTVADINGTSASYFATFASELSAYGIEYASGTFYYVAAWIGETPYNSLQAAIDAASANDTVTLNINNNENNVDLKGKSITFNESSSTFTGTFTGTGTLTMTAMPKAIDTSSLWASGWAGVLWLKNVTFEGSGESSNQPKFDPVRFGNANSTLRLTGCRGGFNAAYTYNQSNHKFLGTLDLRDEGETAAFTVVHAWPNYGKTVFAKLTGSGTLVGSGIGHCYQFEDLSGFSGTITIGNSSDKLRIVMGATAIDHASGGYSSAAKITVQANTSVSIAASKTWTAAGGFEIDGDLSLASTGALLGTISGDGTITYAALPASAPTFGTWTGTVVLPTISSGELNFNSYGKDGSVVRVSNITGGYLPNAVINPTIDIPSGSTMAISAFSPSRPNVLAKLTGAGTLSLPVAADGSNLLGSAATWSVTGYSAYLRIGDVSGFTGSFTADQAVGIVIGSDKPGYRTVGGKIILNSGEEATVGASATWTATTIQVDGNLAVVSGGSLNGSIEGGATGKIDYAAVPSALTFGTWTGTVVLPKFTSTPDGGINLNNYGKTGSTVEFAGMSDGCWLTPPDGGGAVAVKPNLKFTGDVFLSNMSGRVYSFQAISGTGSLSVSSKALTSMSIAKIASDYTGTISNTSGKEMTIVAVDLASEPASIQKILSTSGSNISVSDVTVNGSSLSPLPTLHYQTDGVYIGGTVTTDDTGASPVMTIVPDAEGEASVSLALGESYSGTIVVPPNVTSVTTYGTALALGKVLVKYGETDITSAFTVGGTAGNITIALNASGFVTISEETIYVRPELGDTAPIAVESSTTKPTFAVKAIPGLWYALKSCGTPNGTFTAEKTVQASGTSLSLEAESAVSTVKYYKIAAGVSASDAQSAAAAAVVTP